MWRGLQTTRRTLGTITYAQAGGVGSVDYDTDSVVLTTWLRLQFSITTTTTPMAGPYYNVLARILRDVTIQVQGRDQVVSLAGEDLLTMANLDYGTPPHGAGDSFVLTAAPTTTAYDVFIPIPHFLPRSRVPLTTALDLRGITSATLTVRWGQMSDLVSTVGGGVLDSASVTVVGEYLDNVPQGTPGFRVRSLDKQSVPVTGTDASFQVVLDKGSGLLYRRFVLYTLQDDDEVSTILDGNTFQLVAGNQSFWNVPATWIKAEAKSRDSLATELSGVYPVMIPTLGDPTQMIPTAALDADLRLKTGVTYGSGTQYLYNLREAVRPFLL
jgi:hypothetical protein